MTPTVSVVIPAYNAAAYIRTSVQSALSQTLSGVEVIVVDDGSSDGTADIVKSISDSRLRLIAQENRGQSAALNTGATQALGQYIKFLDADDWINREHLSAQLAALSGSDTMLASCRWGYFVGKHELTRVRTEHTGRDYDDPMEWIVDSLTLDEGMMGGWMWLIPRPVWLRSGGWDERLTLNNDFDFSVRLLLASSGVRFAHGAIYSYRKGVEGALTGSGGEKALYSALLTTEAGCSHLLEREDSARIRRLCADRWQFWLYRFYPDHPTLVAEAERQVQRLGGSGVSLQGGRLLRLLLPVLGWKRVRRMQVRAYRAGWKTVLQWKARQRLTRMR